MSTEDAFAIWAPDGVLWSEWAKPIAFALAAEPPVAAAEPISDAALPMLTGLPFPDSAVIIDLPGADAVYAGLSLAERGFRPVPLFNGTSGPSAVIDVSPITRALVSGAERLRRGAIRADAPPAFLLDSRRSGGTALQPGAYDNRWIALPQDFPSAARLASQGIRTATLLLKGTSIPGDLAHVLRRWQDGGIQIRVADVTTGLVAAAVTVPKPSRFRLAWYAAIALLGLRRSNVGGFGSTIPEATSRSGFYG